MTVSLNVSNSVLELRSNTNESKTGGVVSETKLEAWIALVFGNAWMLLLLRSLVILNRKYRYVLCTLANSEAVALILFRSTVVSVTLMKGLSMYVTLPPVSLCSVASGDWDEVKIRS